MPKNMANEQAIFWLRSMQNDKDVFNSINAENALNLIAKLQKDISIMGGRLNQIRKQRDDAWKAMKEATKGLNTSDEEVDISEEKRLNELYDLW